MIAVNCFAQSQPQPQSGATIGGTVRLQGRGVSDCQVFIWAGWSADIPQYTKPIKTTRESTHTEQAVDLNPRSVSGGNCLVRSATDQNTRAEAVTVDEAWLRIGGRHFPKT